MKNNPSYQKHFDKAVRILALVVEGYHMLKYTDGIDGIEALKQYIASVKEDRYKFDRFAYHLEQCIENIQITDYDECVQFLRGEQIPIGDAIQLAIYAGYEYDTIDFEIVANTVLRSKLREDREKLIDATIEFLNQYISSKL